MKVTIKLAEGNKIYENVVPYFTSDQHFGHDNIRIYQNRPFGTVEEMDEALIKRWNHIVEPVGSLVFQLGDFAFKAPADYARQLNGKIVHVMGNHDKKHLDHYRQACGFDVFPHSYLDLEIECYTHTLYITVCHYCMMTWYKSHFGSWHLFGHTHTDTLPCVGKSMNVCVGVNNEYEPMSLFYIYKHMQKRPNNPNLIPPEKRRY